MLDETMSFDVAINFIVKFRELYVYFICMKRGKYRVNREICTDRYKYSSRHILQTCKRIMRNRQLRDVFTESFYE